MNSEPILVCSTSLPRDSHASSSERSIRARGFTLVELLVVISIIGVLVSLLLPAVQAARESARRIQCVNNLKQIGIAVLLHENTHKHLPTGGWGWNWVGEPDRGFDKHQPGGWVYNILPYIEQQALRSLGTGQAGSAKKTVLTELCQKPLAMFNCPSRRAPGGFPTSADQFAGGKVRLVNTNDLTDVLVARTDYGVNGGGAGDPRREKLGPANLNLEGSFPWPHAEPLPGEAGCRLTGVIFMRSEIKMKQITDGTSNTYLVGEKEMRADGYDTNDPPGDNLPMYIGEDFDTTRYTARCNINEQDGDVYPPQPDRIGVKDPSRFGCAHPGGVNMLFCDGQVTNISYDIDENAHLWLGIRDDGQATILN